MGNRVSKLAGGAKRLTGESASIQNFEKTLLRDHDAQKNATTPQDPFQTPSVFQRTETRSTEPTGSTGSTKSTGLSGTFKDTEKGSPSHTSHEDAMGISSKIKFNAGDSSHASASGSAGYNNMHHQGVMGAGYVEESDESGAYNPFVDPRLKTVGSGYDSSHVSNMNRIIEKVNQERIEEAERLEEESDVRSFGNALMTVSQDIQPIYENTVGDSNSPLAMHTPGKSEIYAKAQKKMKYDDLEGMYKVVDIMNLMKDIRTASQEELKRKSSRGDEFRGKFYSTTSDKSEKASEEVETVDKILDKYSITHQIPRDDLEIISEKFRFPNHLPLGGKEYGFWHDFSLKNLQITFDPDYTGAKRENKASSETTPEEKVNRRSQEEIEQDLLKNLQEMTEKTENSDKSDKSDKSEKKQRPPREEV